MGKIKPGADNGGFSGSLTQRIVKALGVFTGVQSAGMLCSVIRAKLIAMWIGPAGVGLNALLTNALDVLSQLSQAGIRVSAVRSIAATDDGRERTGLITALLRWALWLGSGGAVLTMLLSPLLSLLTFGDYSYSWMFVVLAVAVLASALSVGRSAALQGIGELKRLATLTVTAVIISTLLAIPLFYFFRLKSIVWVVTLFAVVQAAVFYINPGHRGSHRSDLSHRQCFRIGMPFIRLGLVLTMSNALTMVSNFVITVFLNRYASTDEVGIFQAGFAIINNYMGILVSALTVEYFPRLSANIANRRRSEVLVSHQLMILMSLLVPGVIVFLIFSRQIVWLLYSADFMDAVPYLTFAVGRRSAAHDIVVHGAVHVGGGRFPGLYAHRTRQCLHRPCAGHRRLYARRYRRHGCSLPAVVCPLHCGGMGNIPLPLPHESAEQSTAHNHAGTGSDSRRTDYSRMHVVGHR